MGWFTEGEGKYAIHPAERGHHLMVLGTERYTHVYSSENVLD